MKQTANVETLIQSDEISTTEMFCKNILELKNNSYELIDTKNSIKYEIVIHKEFNIEKFYHCVLFIISLNNCESLEMIKSKVNSIGEMTSKYNFDFVMILIANTANKNDKINEKAKSFATDSALFYIEVDFSKKQNTDIFNKILKVRLNQSFSHYTEYYITNIKNHLTRIFDNESIEKERLMTVSSFESKTPPQLPDREEDRAFFSFDENPFLEEVSKNVNIVREVTLLMKLKITFNNRVNYNLSKTLIIPINTNDDGMTVANKINNTFNLKIDKEQEHVLACFLTKKLNKIIELLSKSADKYCEESTNLINLNQIFVQPKKKSEEKFKTVCNLSHEKLIFYTNNVDEVEFIVNEINSYLKLPDKSFLYEIVKSSFDSKKLDSKILIDTTNLFKQVNKALFCVNIDLGNKKTGKILVKVNDDLEMKTNEFINCFNLDREKVYKKIINLLKKLYKETINKKF